MDTLTKLEPLEQLEKKITKSMRYEIVKPTNCSWEEFGKVNKLTKTALSMTLQDINANWTTFGKTPTEQEIMTIFELCLKVAAKVEALERSNCDVWTNEV